VEMTNKGGLPASSLNKNPGASGFFGSFFLTASNRHILYYRIRLNFSVIPVTLSLCESLEESQVQPNFLRMGVNGRSIKIQF
jgi:hypothetical protein